MLSLLSALPIVALAVVGGVGDTQDDRTVAIPHSVEAAPPPVPIPIMQGYNPPAVKIPIAAGLILSSASYRIDNANGPLLRASWMSVSTPAGKAYYLRCHEARAGVLRNGTTLRPVTIATVYGRSRIRRGPNECHYSNTPSPAGMKTAYQATFRNASGTVTRSAAIVLNTTIRYTRV